MFEELIVVYIKFVEHFLWLISLHLQRNFGGVRTMSVILHSFTRKEDGIQVLVGLAPSSQTVESFYNLFSGKAGQKKSRPPKNVWIENESFICE